MSYDKPLKINLVGSNSVGYVGEVADELIIEKALKELGHNVQFVPRDIWKAWADGERNPDWENKLPNKNADINILFKWHHFGDEKYINKLRETTNAPVLYWVWDYMNSEDFHMKCLNACDLYLGNDVHSGKYNNDKCYYFPFDCADGEYVGSNLSKIYDVVFFGSCLDQGLRKEWLPKIADHCELKIFSWNWEEWEKLGLDAYKPVYGYEFAKIVSQSKICIQFSVNDYSWGYWSNRTGKILSLGGFLLAHYAPGMELFLRDMAEYFTDVDEAIGKIKYYLKNYKKTKYFTDRAKQFGKRFTIQERTKDLTILMERFLKGALEHL